MRRTTYRVVKVVSNRVATMKIRKLNLLLECGHSQKLTHLFTHGKPPVRAHCFRCEDRC